MGNSTSFEDQIEGRDIPVLAKTITGIADTVIIISNLMILIALIRSSKIRKNVYTSLVLMLTLSDLLLGLYSVASLIIYETGFFNRATCSVMLHIFMTGVASSLYNTFLICVNRLLAAFTNERLNRIIFLENLKKTVGGIAVFIQLYLLSTILLQSHENIQDACSYYDIFGDNITTFGRVIVMLYVPIFISIIIMYLITLCRIHSHYKRNRVQDQTPSEASDRTVQQAIASNAIISHKRHILAGIRTLGLVLLALTLLTGPFVFSLVIFALGRRVSLQLIYLVSVLVLLNSFTNPIIYTLRFQELRSELKSICFDFLQLLKRMKNACRECRCRKS